MVGKAGALQKPITALEAGLTGSWPIMLTLLIAVGSFVGFIVAYHTYGRWLARKVFNLNPEAEVPSQQFRDDIDYVPSKRDVVFGHHFTSIAGTGPIVGPAIAVFWGWLPALLWVLVGSIFIGAVHDFGALVVSLRNRGQTVGQVAGRVINPRAKLLFLIVLFFCLMIVIGIFGLVIAVIFARYPQSVLSVWVEIPLALVIGWWVYRRGGGLLWSSLAALATMYLAIWIGAYYLPLVMPHLDALGPWGSPIVTWTVILMVYCFVASVLPVWVLLQPRDYINSHELLLALVLLMGGLVVVGVTNQADIRSAPAIAQSLPADAPPMIPFLFITIACGAVSGFHCLVSSGTSSKQLSNETDAQYVGYGAMLLEGALAVIVILACCAGLGMGVMKDGAELVGRAAWESRYVPSSSWAAFGLPQKVGAFVDGGANFLAGMGIPLAFGAGIIAVLVASFAATTLDTATRLQRYVVNELGAALRIRPLQNKYVATVVAVATGGALALIPGPKGAPGTGGLILWPLFGASNQLLAGLALMVTTFYLWRRGKRVWFVVIPMGLMLVIPGWAMLGQAFTNWAPWLRDAQGNPTGSPLLFALAIGITVLQVWMMIEALLMWPRTRGVLEEALPSLRRPAVATEPTAERGRSC
jgi:carbon starvation protein